MPTPSKLASTRSNSSWNTHPTASCSAGGDLDEIRIYDAEQGKDVSITDGHWIITIGMYGLFGFVAEFGLLALTVFRAASALRFTQPARDRIYLAALALIVAINMVELLPNATLTPWTWLFAGALLGRAEALRSARWIPSSANSNLLSNGYRRAYETIKARDAQ